jgi:hypothetical protein
MIARGKRRASEARRPWINKLKDAEALKERNKLLTGLCYFALSVLNLIVRAKPGATRLAELSACPWLPYFAPSALHKLYSVFEARRLVGSKRVRYLLSAKFSRAKAQKREEAKARRTGTASSSRSFSCACARESPFGYGYRMFRWIS